MIYNVDDGDDDNDGVGYFPAFSFVSVPQEKLLPSYYCRYGGSSKGGIVAEEKFYIFLFHLFTLLAISRESMVSEICR